MLFLDFLEWWYGSGWTLRVQLLAMHVQNSVEYFSIGLLLRTLLSPWRQNITVARPDQSLQTKMSAIVDNAISRLVGFFVRVFVLIAAIITIVAVFAFNLVIILLWPMLPLSPAILLGVGLTL